MLRDVEQVIVGDIQHRLVLNAMSDAIHLADMNLVFIWANDVYLRWLEEMGVDSNIVGLTIREAIPFLPDIVFDEYRRALVGETVITVERTSLPNGSFVDTETRKIPIIADGKVGGVITILRDATELNRQRTALEESELSLKVSNAELMEYSHVVSHELRNPLISISKMASIIRRDCIARDGPPDCITFLQQIAEKADMSLVMIDDLLRYSEVGRVEVRSEAVDLQLVTSRMADEIRVSLPGDIFISGSLPTIQSDPVLLRQIIRNLVENGLKHNNYDQKMVRVQGHEEGGHVVLDVSDNGIGITPDLIPHMFEPYVRRGEHMGSGMGLAIVKRACDALGIEIAMEAQVEGGTTFHLIFPR